MATRKHILHIGKWFTLALMLGSILSPTVSLANTVDSKAAPQESTEATLQTLSSDSLIPESSTESTSAAETTANSDITTTENTSSGEVEPTIIQGAATIDENKLSIHEDQKNPQPSIKDQKIEQKEKHVYFSGKLFAGKLFAGKDTDNGKSQTTVSYFALQSKVASNEWQTEREWLKEETSVSEQTFTFDTEVLLKENQTYTFRYVLQYKIQKEDQDQHLIEEKTDQGYFELSNEYVYQSKEIIADQEKENAKTEKTTDATKVAEEKETKIPEETKNSESTTPSGKTSIGTSANDQVIERDDIPEPKQQEQTKSRSSSLPLRGIEIKPMSYYYDTFGNELSNMRGESGSMTTGIYGYEGHFIKTSDNSVSVHGQLIGDRVTHSDGSLAWERLVQGIFILYREQGSSTWIKGTQVWSGSKANEWISYSGTHTGLQLGKTYEFAVGVNFFHNGQRPSLWPTLELSGWFGATTGGTIDFPIPPPPSVGNSAPSNITANSVDISCIVNNSSYTNEITSLHIRKATDLVDTELNIRSGGVTQPSGTKNGYTWTNGNAGSTGTGMASLKISGLTPKTKYIIQMFILTSDGKVYSGPSSDFTTEGPTVGSIPIYNLTANSAHFKCGIGNINLTNQVTAFRIKKVSDGSYSDLKIRNSGTTYSTGSANGLSWTNGSAVATGSGVASLDVTGLTPGTDYTVQAYIETSDGKTYWGTMNSFTTLVPTVASVPIYNLTANSAHFKCGIGNINLINRVTAFRIKKVSDGSYSDLKIRNSGTTYSTGSANGLSWTNGSAVATGSGVASLDVTGLTPGTDYTVQAYIETSDGKTYWGTMNSFTTLVPTVASVPIYNLKPTSVHFKCGIGNINLINKVTNFKLTQVSTLTVSDLKIRNNATAYPSGGVNGISWTNGSAVSTGDGIASVDVSGLIPGEKYIIQVDIETNDGRTYSGAMNTFTTPYNIYEEYVDISGNTILSKEIEVQGGKSYISTPSNSFTHNSQAYIYQGWLGELEWDGNSGTPMPSLNTGPVNPLTTHGQKVYLIYDLDSNSLRLDNYPNKFDFGDQHDLQTYNQIFDLDSSKYSSTEPTDGFKVRVRDDRVSHPGWHLTTNFSKMKGVSNPLDELSGAKISFGVDLKEIQNPGTSSETPIPPGPNAPTLNSGILSGSTAVVPADGNTKNFLQAANTKGEGVWDVLIDFDSVKLFVPAGQGAIGEKYQGTIQWDLEDTP
ncbi:WxL domain-containing protein [Enterococcus hulanensis]|uniref:WxL domain-containing protein n=1 Tax=Enterococcus hulanensis TaxID=2559929 RepID=UPI00289040F1|nr:WxL domain-containing protein [Enterococcus hulanensis]MDT2661650.1 WxL domain-containing protein [Enterococcus hulanensis]